MAVIRTSMLDYWLHHVQEYLSECQSKFFGRRMDKLINEHDKLMSQKGEERRYGFIYNGLLWRLSERPPEWFDHLLPLDVSLHDEMDTILQEQVDTERDFHRIRQNMLLAFRKCQNNQDLRDTIPECLLPAFKHDKAIFELPRTTEAGPLGDVPSTVRTQWDKAVERAEYHSAMRLILS